LSDSLPSDETGPRALLPYLHRKVSNNHDDSE
jgi:hypothetical protein